MNDHPGEDAPLCGDPTCEGPGCRQSSIDAWYRRQWDEAGAIVGAALGLRYDPATGDYFGSSIPPQEEE